MWRRAVPIGALSLLTVLSTIPSTSAPAAAVASGSLKATVYQVSGSPTELIADIPVTPALTAGYARNLFVDSRAQGKDSRGCSRQVRLLIAKSDAPPAVLRNCVLRGGVWTLANGEIVRGPSRVSIIGVLDTPTAWAHGAYGWTAAQRRAFANVSVVAAPRQATSASSTRVPRSLLATVLADEPGNVCREMQLVVRALVAWGLSVDSSTRSTLFTHAQMCPDDELIIQLKNTTTRVPPAGANNPYASRGNSQALAGPTSILQASAGPVIGSELFGLHIPPAAGLNPPVRHGYVRLWDSDVGWNDIQPRSGTFVWRTFDSVVAAAEASGAKVEYVLGPTPSWAGDVSTDPPRRMSEFRTFVEALVHRYGDRINAIEVWNEPNLQNYYTGTATELVEMTTILANVVRRAGVRTEVLAASTTTRTTGSFYNFYSAYLKGLRKADWPIDGFTFHSYPRASGTPADRIGAVTMFKAMLTFAGAPKLPVYETEINYGLAGQDEPHRVIDGADARGYLAQTYVDAVRSGIQTVDWYLWSRADYPLLGIQLNLSRPGTIEAWNWTYDQLVGSSLRSCADQGAASVCGFTRNGHDFALAYSAMGDEAALNVPASLTLQCDMRENCSAIADSTVRVGIEPILLR
ncbi:MAG: hypothetical protein PSX37_03955 [bacterium]|nr:hypothetical protein [bacterium]